MNLAEYGALLAHCAGGGSPVPDTLAGLALARRGRVVSCGEPPAAPPLAPDAQPTPHAPNPYRLSQWVDAGDGWAATNDRLELDIHGAASMTHIDALSHFDQSIPGDPLLELARTGLVGRGVLIDVPGVLGIDVTGRAITRAEVEETLTRSGLELRPGDILFVHLGRTGARSSADQLGGAPSTGLSIECAPLVAAAKPAAVVTDYGLDPFPSEVNGHPVPWHVLVLNALRIPLVDMAALSELSATCAELRTWEFLAVIAPLPIPSASGSPVNPIAVF